MSSEIKKQKVLLILSMIGILILLFIAQTNPKEIYGTIKSISYSENRVTIHLKETNIEIILFSNQLLDLKQDQKISIQGKTETYKNKIQILTDKITKYD